MGYLTVNQAYDPRENEEEFASNNMSTKKVIHTQKRQSCYYSDIVGEYIKDAVTGAKYPWKVGSKDDERFFRVTYTTG